MRLNLKKILQGTAIEDTDTPPLPFIVSNAILAIVAGSDTTATTLSNCFFYLLSNKPYYLRLKEEIDQAISYGDPLDINTGVLQGLPYLNAVVYVSKPWV